MTDPTLSPAYNSIAYVRTAAACVFTGDNALAIGKIAPGYAARTVAGVHCISIPHAEIACVLVAAFAKGYVLSAIDGETLHSEISAKRVPGR